MSRKCFSMENVRRAACSCLFFGMLCCLTGCVKPVVGPEITDTPVPTLTGGVPTPVPDTPTPVPEITGEEIRPTEEPIGTPDNVPTITTEPNSTPDLSPTTGAEDSVSATPRPEKTPTVVPKPIVTPEPAVTPTQVPVPTGQPDYMALLQNGWQRTEDFFGNREIFFSGIFDETEPVVSSGRYEFRYTASSDAGVSFSIIGEEGLTVQEFLDKLIQGSRECWIEPEGEADYSYTYTDGDIRVMGRIYACRAEDKVHRMRVEFCSSISTEEQTEGYTFFLRETKQEY